MNWFLKPTNGEAPISLQVIGVVALYIGIKAIYVAIADGTRIEIVQYILLGGCSLAIGWALLTGRPIGLAGGFVFWSWRSIVVLQSLLGSDDYSQIAAIGSAILVWLLGIGILYKNASFFLGNDPTATERVE